MSTPTVDKIMVAMKAAVDRNFNFHHWQDSGSSESYSYRVQKVFVDLAEKENVKCDRPTFLTVWQTHMWGGIV